MQESELFEFLEEFYYKYKAGTLEPETLKQLNEMSPDWIERVESELAKAEDMKGLEVGGQKREEIYDMLHTEPSAILKALDEIAMYNELDDETADQISNMVEMVIKLQELYDSYTHALKLDSFVLDVPDLPFYERLEIITSKPLFEVTVNIFMAINTLIELNPELNGNDSLVEVWFQTANAQDRLEIIEAYYKDNVVPILDVTN